MKLSNLFLLLLALPCIVMAGTISPGLLDMELPTLSGDDIGSIRSHLNPGELLVVVLWNSECPDCMENVVQAREVDLAVHNARLLGVCFDYSRWDCLAFTRERGVSYPQLHDTDGLLAAALQAEEMSFTFAILNGDGDLLAIHYDSVDDARTRIEEALTAVRGAESAGSQQRIRTTSLIPAEVDRGARSIMGQKVHRRYPSLKFSGNIKVRQLAVGISDRITDEGGDCGCGLGGPYGESLHPLSDLLYRLTLNVETRLAAGVRAGGMLRISNEDPAILERGPLYLTSKFGSAFIEVRQGDWTGRLGYFSRHLTPLTLQRWDAADNPPSAGSGSSCGVCTGSARALSLEALDDVGPDITMEGALVEGAPCSRLSLVAFYGRLLRQRDWDSFDPDAFRYRRDLLGAGVILKSGLTAWGKAALGFNYVRMADATSSNPWPATMPYTDAHALSRQNEVISANLEGTLPWGTNLNAEFARSFSRTDQAGAHYGEGLTGEAWLCEVSQAIGNGPRVAAAWIGIGRDFRAAYGAMSYQPDTEGPRVQIDYLRTRWGVRLFGKRMTRDRGNWSNSSVPAEKTVTGGLLTIRAAADLDFDLTASRTQSRENCCSSGPDCECNERAWTISARYELARHALMTCEYSRLTGSGDPDVGEAMGDIGSVFVTVDF
ncbi:MAG: hypothetical protein GY835_07280 [bacterium]|nr:hypothetical protein [bacterium]